VHPGVLECDGGHAGESQEQLQVVLVKGLPVETVDDLRNTSDPVAHLERDRDHGFGAVAGRLIIAAKEFGMGIGVLQEQSRPLLRDGTGDALAHLEPHFLLELLTHRALCNLVDQLIGLLVDAHEARGVGIHHLLRDCHDVLEDRVDLERRTDERVHLDKRGKALDLLVNRAISLWFSMG